MTRALNISGSNLLQHLRILRTAGVLTCSRRKRQVYCFRTSADIKSLSAPCVRYSTSNFVICRDGLLSDIDREQS